MFKLFPLVLTMLVATSRAADEAPGTSRALIVVGLPGDAEHEALFKATAGRWRDWLTGPLGFPANQVRVVSATRESFLAESKSLKEQAKAEDRTWVFVLGHANVDDGHAFLHLPGPDVRDDEFAAAFKGLLGREQVFWMTTAASGWFVKDLSAPGRVVVAATERDKEFNETEFPHALVEVVKRPTAKLDADRDGKVSVWELFVATSAAVEAKFAADKRLATEHAQLDDNGDGVGTESKPEKPPASLDGALASKTFIPSLK